MASVTKTIEILFIGTDEVSPVSSSIVDDLGQMNTAVADMTAPFAGLAEGVLKADIALAALAGGSLAYAFKASKDFESSIISLDKIMQGNTAGVIEARQQALDLSAAYGQSAISILDSTTSFKKAGFDINEAMILTKSSLDLVIAGEVEAGLASELIISTLKGFGAEAEESARLVDILNSVSNNYATTAEQLGIGMSKLSPIASQMGFSFEETAGILTPVIEIFRSGDEAAIAYRTGLLKLIDDAKPVRDALASIGVSQTDTNGALRSGRDIYYEVAEAFQTVNEDQKLFVAAQLVGIRQAAKLVVGFDGLAQTLEVTRIALGSTGSALSEVEKRLLSAEVAVGRFIAGFNALSIGIGDQFLAASKEVIEGGIDIEKALAQAVDDDSFKPLFDALESGLNGLGAALSQIGEDLPEALANIDYTKFLDSFEALGDSLSDMFSDIDFSTADGLEDIIQTVVDAVGNLINTTAGMVDGASPFIEALQTMIEEFAALDAATAQAGGEFTGFAAALNVLTGPIGTLIDALSAVGTAMEILATGYIASLIIKLAGGKGLSWAFTSAGAAATALSLPLIALVGAVAGVGAAILALIDKKKLDAEADAELEKSLARGITAREDLAKKYEEISKATGVFIQDSVDLKKAIADGTIALNKQTGSWEKVLTAEEKVTAAINASENALVDWSDASNGLVDAQGDLKGVVDGVADALSDSDRAARDAAVAYYVLQGNSEAVASSMVDFELANGGLSGALEQTSESLQKTAEDSQETHEKMLELASDEKIKTMEFSASLEIAGIEAATDQLDAAFSSIDNTVATLTGSIGDLFGQLGDSDSFSEKWALESQISAENEAREETLRLQNALLEAQVKAQEIRNDQAAEGGGLIQITADGLEPELEAFMFKILERVQVRITESSSDFLLVT